MAELSLFGPAEGFVYAIPTNVSTNGHRAELWDVQNPLATVQVRVSRQIDTSGSREDSTRIRLFAEAGQLFAEAPVTCPLQTCVERAIDSSRYFCVRVVDGESGKHAFLGLGFESRDVAGDFFSSLVDHVQYVERQTREGERGERGAQPLNAPVTLHLNSNSGLSHSGAGFVSGKKEGLSKTFSLMFAKGGGLEAALSSASTDSPLGGSSRRGTGTDTEAEFDGGWGAFESAEDS